MKLFPEDPKFAPGSVGFDDRDGKGRPYDLLGRKPVGQRLTDLLDRVEQPLVIALDGGWGSGKSHFLKLWTGAHSLELGGRAKVIYFDAFEHDYLDDPLISLIAALLKHSEGEKEKEDKPFSKTALSKIKSTGMRLAKPGLRIGLAVATAGASEMANAVWDEGLKAAEGLAADAIEDFWKKESGRTAAMQQFRDALTALTAPANKDETSRKIVFIIDELDRCRPDYALTLLEIVKHFFAVPNVHFVLGTNMAALENSVRARYGANINATEYLSKFIHLRMSLPNKQDHQGNGPWATYFDDLCQRIGQSPNCRKSLREVLTHYSKTSQISLRDVQRLLTRMALFPAKLDNDGYAYIRLATSALLMDVLSPEHFARLRTGKLEIEEVIKLLGLQSAGTEPQSSANRLKHLWRFVLLPEPGDETKSFVGQAFSYAGNGFSDPDFERLWEDFFDTFQVVADND